LTYEYLCPKCDLRFDVIKTVSEMNREEPCGQCGAPAERQFTPRIHIHGAKVENAEYNPGLGCVVKNKRHREELCKRKGLVEIGNDFKSSESLQSTFEKERTEKMRKRYDDI
jgi:putative FmdB family regulatory protein